MRVLFPLLGLLLLTPLHSRAQTADKPSPIQVAMQKFVDEGQIAGAVTFLAQKDDEMDFSVVGFRDLENKKPMEKDTLFWIASMTKPITALAIMLLQDDGKLNINDPVSKFLPEFKGQMLVKEKTDDQVILVKPAQPVTIKHLLTHTSGLVGKSPVESDALDVLTLQESVISYGLSPLQFEPGSKWSYCNPGINTLGRVIEVASGMEYSKFLGARIFRPLGMKNTTFWPKKKDMEKLALSYKLKEDGKGLEITEIKYLTPPFSNTKRTPLAAGGLFSTAEDLFLFYSLFLNNGHVKGRRYLSDISLKLMTENHTGDLKAGFTEGMGMGLGFQVVVKPAGVTSMLSPGTFGHGGAYGTQSWGDPSNGSIYILLIQRAGLSNGDASPMRQAFQEAAEGLLR